MTYSAILINISPLIFYLISELKQIDFQKYFYINKFQLKYFYIKNLNPIDFNPY